MSLDYLIVGAGFAGSVMAERLASTGARCLVIDRRDHIGGNAFDCVDAAGVLIHPYGPHIFHTNSQRIFDYLSRFTEWRFYEHRVLAAAKGQLVPLPINRTTVNTLYGLDLDEAGVAAFLEEQREPRETIRTSEDVVLNSVGAELCDTFFRNYTRKQWGLDLSELSAGVAARIPTRTNDDDRYFTDRFQFMPRDGYAAMFRRMLDHPLIDVRLEEDYFDNRSRYDAKHVIYSGPIDRFFDYRFGKLPYRSLSFEHEHLPEVERYQPTGTVNYPDAQIPYTRITEFPYLTGQQHTGTSIVREHPQDDGDPFYPIPRPENETLFKRYAELARETENVTFVGRLAQYRYYNMDQVVGAALTAARALGGEKVDVGLIEEPA